MTNLINIFDKIKFIFTILNVKFNLYVLKDKFLLEHKRWVSDQGDKTLRVNYDLTPESIVIDLGGYKGDFADVIYKKYSCHIYIFEPITSFYQDICQRFNGNEKIKVFNFGLSDKDVKMEINLNDDGSSFFKYSYAKEVVELKDIVSFFNIKKIHKVDLIKINIEGGEFQILPVLIDTGLIKNINNVQVQFHSFIESANEKRDNIRVGLKKTHYLTYDYWFIWENWRRKE